jgi:hypothetical protein
MSAAALVLILVCAGGVVWLLHRAHQRDDELLAKVRGLAAASDVVAGSIRLLDFIAAQFRTNDGHSLRDVIDRLDEAARLSQRSADLLKVQADVTRELAGQDRQRLDRLMTLVRYLDEHVAEGSATGIRIEEAAGHVADDLAERYQRADDTIGPHGAASDAAAQSAPLEEQA